MRSEQEPSLLFEPDEAYPEALVCRGEDGCGALITPMGDLSHRMFHLRVQYDDATNQNGS